MTTKNWQKRRLIVRFFKNDKLRYNRKDWNYAMAVVSKIEEIIEGFISIKDSINMNWAYSRKKTGTFEKGFGGGGGHTIERTPFEFIFGKNYSLSCYFQKKLEFKPKKNEIADTKIEAVWNVCERFITWYNKTVLK